MAALFSPTRPQVLVVEDDSELRELLETMLSEEGYDFTGAASPKEALVLLETTTFDLILTDLFTRSVSDPLGSVTLLRKHAQPTPIGIVTAWKLPSKVAEQQGFAWVLRKPFEIQDLLQAIARSLNPPFSPEQAQQAQTIERYLSALSNGEWEVVQALCSPTVCYYPPRSAASTSIREIRGLDAYLTYARQALTRYPDYRIDHCTVFLHKQRLVTRFACSWRGADGQRLRMAGTVMCRFVGERLARIAVFLDSYRLQSLLASTREASHQALDQGQEQKPPAPSIGDGGQ